MATGGEVTYIINSEDKDFTRAIDSADSKMGAFDKKSRNVALLVSAWIEMIWAYLDSFVIMVALLVSAWIEIVKAVYATDAVKSHSS